MPEVWDVLINGKFSGIKVTNFLYDSKVYAAKSEQTGKKYYLRPESGGNAPDAEDISMRKGVLLRRWATTGNRYWYELYRFPYGLAYYMDNGGGQLGTTSVTKAVAYLEKQLADAGLIDGIHYSEVYPRERPIEASKKLGKYKPVPNKVYDNWKGGPSGLGGIR